MNCRSYGLVLLSVSSVLQLATLGCAAQLATLPVETTSPDPAPLPVIIRSPPDVHHELPTFELGEPGRDEAAPEALATNLVGRK
jgi:hypothetical protein